MRGDEGAFSNLSGTYWGFRIWGGGSIGSPLFPAVCRISGSIVDEHEQYLYQSPPINCIVPWPLTQDIGIACFSLNPGFVEIGYCDRNL